MWLYLDVLVYILLIERFQNVHRNSFLLFCLYTLHKKVPYLPNFAKLVFRPLINSIFFHILYKTTYLSPILTFYEKIRENLTKYDHFSKYYELKNLWLRYDTNLTYYEFHICLTIRFDTTFKKPITPTLSSTYSRRQVTLMLPVSANQGDQIETIFVVCLLAIVWGLR